MQSKKKITGERLKTNNIFVSFSIYNVYYPDSKQLQIPTHIYYTASKKHFHLTAYILYNLKILSGTKLLQIIKYREK